MNRKNLVRSLYVLAGVALLAAGAGCPSSRPEGTVIATVNNDHLTREQFDALLQERVQVDRENLPRILDKWVANSLMYQEAIKRGLRDDPETKLYLERIERDYLVNQLLQKLTAAVSVSQTELLDYYNAHKDEFSYEVKIMRIVLPDSMMAERTLAEIRAGGDFKKLARERSQDRLLEAGQESNYIPRGIGGGDPTLEEAIFALRKGEVSDVLSSQEGFQIIKLVDRKKVKGEVSFAEKKTYIDAVLGYRKGEALVDSLLTELRAGAEIELRPDAYFE